MIISNTIFQILKLLHILLSIINIFKLRKYIFYNNVSYSDNTELSMDKISIIIHTLSFQILIFILIFKLKSYYYLILPLNLINFILIIFSNFKFHLGVVASCLSVIINIGSLILLLFFCLIFYKSKYNINIINIILIILIIPNIVATNVDIFNLRKLVFPSYGTNPIPIVQNSCPFSFLKNNLS